MRGSLCAAASLAALLTIGAAPAPAAMAIHLTSVYDHPGARVGVNGAGFGAYATIDIYFDTTDELIVTANASGAFSKHSIPVPADALPGEHWISASERDNGQGVQKPFTVSTDWTELGFDSRNRRNNRWENVVSTANVNALDVMWSHKTGDTVESSPAVANGIAYVGSHDQSLYAFDVLTGTVLWSVPTGGPVISSPAVAGGIVCFGSTDGSVYAVDAATGAGKWTVQTGNAINASPVIANGIVYIGSTDGKLYAIDAATGDVSWSVAMDGPINASPAVFDGAVYSVSDTGRLQAFDAVTGAVLWNSAVTDPTNSAPVVSGGSIWIVSSSLFGPYHLERIRASDGGFVSGTDLGGSGGGENTEAAPAVANGIVYVSFLGQVIAFQPNGSALTQLWTASLGVVGVLPSAPAVANGVVYAQGGNNFFAFDALTGNTLWSGITAGGGANLSSPAISNGAAFIGGDRRLFAFALNGGNNKVYRHRHTRPPALASLHPDLRLKTTP